jgi:Asp-tRNA(Asn)/Glu-tRNA(Gln) amidotransferase A subunit family amidase
LTPRRQEIIELSFEDLRHSLRTGAVTAVQALLAFQAKALSVQDKTNAVIGFLEDALERARQLDQVPEDQRKPLHGMPISLKVMLNRFHKYLCIF